jgi:hypothetical protein
MKIMPRIFLSYAREDREKVEVIYQRLIVEGFAPWMDVKNISAGQAWEAKILEALHNSDFVLVFLSKNSINKKGYIQKELRAALEMLAEFPPDDIFLIPIRLEECDIPSSLRNVQNLDIFEEGALNKLIVSLKAGAERKGIDIGLIKKRIIEEEKYKAKKPHLFIAMPFTKDMEDIFYYGIQRAVDANDYVCKRMDKEYFTGDIIEQIKNNIITSAAVIAELSNSNPNVYLEVGYAWGKEIPTILLIQDSKELSFDVRGQRCLIYNTIKSLEDLLTKELEELRAKSII